MGAEGIMASFAPREQLGEKVEILQKRQKVADREAAAHEFR